MMLMRTATLYSVLRPVLAFQATTFLPRIFAVRTPLQAALTMTTTTTANPLLSDWSNQPYKLPPFKEIQSNHFAEALHEGMKLELDDLQAIVDGLTDFESVIARLDRAGAVLERVQLVFSNLCSSQNTNELQAVQTKMAPILSRHHSSTYQFPGLFDKIDSVYQNRDGLNSEQKRLTERIYMDFTRAGAALPAEQQDELADIRAKLASLTTTFTQNVLKDEEETYFAYTLEDLDGCPDSLIAAAKSAAEERGQGGYLITLSRSLVEPFLTSANRRDLRQQAWKAWTKRGELNADRDNRDIAVQILQLRKQIAQIHGYESFAHFQCVDRMAKTPEKVMELLENVWERAKVAADAEQREIENYLKDNNIELEGGVQAYDWRFYAEKVRKAKYDFDDSLLKPYLTLDSVRDSLFAVSNKLFGLKYSKVDSPTYHADVEVFEVRESANDGTDRLVSVFLHDNFSRPFKSGGAWMSEYRGQSKNLVGADSIDGIPIISNNNNLAKGTEVTLLSPDDARTMFHEFGHAHHGMLSDVTYSRLSGTNVLTDFVELPSQLMEHWLDYAFENARHYQTGEPIPKNLLDKLKKSETFQEGFRTIEYTACALLDMALHMQSDYNDFDLIDFEKAELERLGMPSCIIMRHRPAHFQHLFSTDMYAAGYYVYQWASVLEHDAFAAFEEADDVFDPETSARVRKFIYSSGNTQAPDELFREFRGRDPDIKYFLMNKGLLTETS